MESVENLSKLWQDLEAGAAKLNDARNDMNGLYKNLEDFIRSLNLGLEVKVPLYPDNKHPSVFFGYEKIAKGRWGFTIEDDKTIWPIQESPIHYRMQALSRLHMLMQALQEEARTTSARLREAAELANKVLENMK